MSGGSAVSRTNNSRMYHSDMAVDISIEKKCNVLVEKNGSRETTLLDYISELKKEEGTAITGNGNLVHMDQSMFFFDRLRVHGFIRLSYRLDNIRSYRRTLVSLNEAYGNRFDLNRLRERQIGILSGGEGKLPYFLLIMSLDKS